MFTEALWTRNVSSSKDESLPSPMWKRGDINNLSPGSRLLSLINVTILLPIAAWLSICWQLLDQL